MPTKDRGRTIGVAIVTGCTGAIGNALVRRLLDDGCSVYAVVRSDSPRAASLPACDGLHVVPCDLSTLGSLAGIVGEQCDAFFHLAWACTTGAGRNDMPAQIANIQYTIDACHAAAELGCNVFVGAGSQAEYGRVDCALAPDTPCFPENGYGMAKLCAGQMSRIECLALGIDHIWPRILSVYGPHDGANAMIPQVIGTLLDGEVPALTSGEQVWDYLYADDAAEALYRMALYGRDGAVYPLGSGMARPLRDYICEVRDAIRPELSLGFGEIPYGPAQVMHLQADLTALHADTGFQPQTDFKTGIRKTIEWVASQRTTA